MSFQAIHASTEGLHYEGPSRDRGDIIIDAAEITPGHFEVMVLDQVDEVEVATASSAEAARRAYRRFMRKYVEPEREPRPLAGKYAKLRDDLKKALAAGVEAEKADPDDWGTCNLDATALVLPLWSEKLVERAAKEAGTGCFTWTLFGCRHFVFIPNTRGQAYARTRNAEAMTREMRRLGYDATDYSQMD